jgi:hypothetical protein
MLVRWLTAFLDTPRGAPGAADSLEFWRQVTRTRLSLPRGEHQELTTLLPSAGDAFLCAQGTGKGCPGCHVDVHVDDVRAAANDAVRAGAQLLADYGTLAVVRIRACVSSAARALAVPEVMPDPSMHSPMTISYPALRSQATESDRCRCMSVNASGGRCHPDSVAWRQWGQKCHHRSSRPYRG